jgi:hypothetical protein
MADGLGGLDMTATDDEIAALLARIQADQRRAGEAKRARASEAAIADLSVRIQTILGLTLPPDYADFLRLSDGLEYNGLVLYDCASTCEEPTHGFWQGVVATNLMWRDGPRAPGLLYLGETDMDLVGVDNAHRFLTIDRISDDITDNYPSFAALFAALMVDRI